jgi:hypothetical protein
LTTIALAPGVFILSYNIASLRQSREAEVRAQAFQIGNLATLEVQRIIGGAQGTLNAVARAPTVRSFDIAGCNAYLQDLLAKSAQFNAIAVIDRGGLLRCRAPTLEGEQHYDDRAYFQEALAKGEFIVGEYTVSKNNKQAFLPLAVPIFGKEGDTVGVLVGGLRLNWLRDVIRQRPFPKNEALSIADRNGVLLAREPFSERFVGTRIPEEFQSMVRATSPGVV